MKTTINNQEVEITYAGALTSGYGHKKITVEIYHDGSSKRFAAVTSNMPGYDAAMDIEDIDERYFAFYELIADKIEEEVIDWLP